MDFMAAAGGPGAVLGGKMLQKAWGCYNWQQAGRSFYLSMVVKVHAEVVCWQQVLKTVVH